MSIQELRNQFQFDASRCGSASRPYPLIRLYYSTDVTARRVLSRIHPPWPLPLRCEAARRVPEPTYPSASKIGLLQRDSLGAEEKFNLGIKQLLSISCVSDAAKDLRLNLVLPGPVSVLYALSKKWIILYARWSNRSNNDLKTGIESTVETPLRLWLYILHYRIRRESFRWWGDKSTFCFVIRNERRISLLVEQSYLPHSGFF